MRSYLARFFPHALAASVALAALFVLLPAASASEGAAAGQDDIAAALNSYAAALEAKDIDGIGAVVTEDLLMFEGAHVNRGWADYRDHHLAPEMKEFSDGFRYAFDEVETASEGDLAWATFKYTIHAESDKGAYDGGGVGTAILERGDDGAWRISHLHTSAERRSR